MPQAMMTLDDESADPTRADLLTMFRETATEVVEKDFHHVARETVISELAIDSLGMLEIIGSLERQPAHPDPRREPDGPSHHPRPSRRGREAIRRAR